MKKAVKNAMAADILNANMVIYTRTGDKGKTSLYGGKRVSKADLQVEAYGSIDELTSFLGLVNSFNSLTRNSKLLITDIQRDLYQIMSSLSGSNVTVKYLDQRVKEFEKQIDQMDKKLPKLTRFILPGGNEFSAWFHILRTICRRAERNVVRYSETLTTNYQLLTTIKYLNRLSDLFFTLARFYNKGKDHLA